MSWIYCTPPPECLIGVSSAFALFEVVKPRPNGQSRVGHVLFPVFCAFVSSANAQLDAFEGTLQDYLALGEDGVRIGETVYSDFTLVPLQTGNSALGSARIDVVPLFEDSSSPGFRFSLMDGATADDIFELRFSFRVSGSVFDGARLSLSDVNASGNGGSDVLLDIGNTGGTPGDLTTLIAFSSPNAGDELDVADSFSASSDITVEFDAVIDGGDQGRPGEITTSLGSATIRIDQTPLPARAMVLETGFADPTTFFIEFVASPGASYSVRASASLEDGFPTPVTLSSGDGVAGSDGFERIEFTVPQNAPAQFYRVETTS